MANRDSRVRVLVVFALCGGLAAASSVLKHLFSQHPHWDFLTAASIAEGIILSEGAPYIALLAGGILTVWIMALAFRIASRHWPPRIWLSALAVALGVPAVTVIAGHKYWRTPDLLFIEPSLGGIPPVLLIGELALAVVVGHWLYATAARAST